MPSQICHLDSHKGSELEPPNKGTQQNLPAEGPRYIPASAAVSPESPTNCPSVLSDVMDAEFSIPPANT